MYSIGRILVVGRSQLLALRNNGQSQELGATWPRRRLSCECNYIQFAGQQRAGGWAGFHGKLAVARVGARFSLETDSICCGRAKRSRAEPGNKSRPEICARRRRQSLEATSLISRLLSAHTFGFDLALLTGGGGRPESQVGPDHEHSCFRASFLAPGIFFVGMALPLRDGAQSGRRGVACSGRPVRLASSPRSGRTENEPIHQAPSLPPAAIFTRRARR